MGRGIILSGPLTSEFFSHLTMECLADPSVRNQKRRQHNLLLGFYSGGIPPSSHIPLVGHRWPLYGRLYHAPVTTAYRAAGGKRVLAVAVSGVKALIEA